MKTKVKANKVPAKAQKGKKGKGEGKGKDVNAVEAGSLKEEPEAECSALELCAFDPAPDIERPDGKGWLKMNLDTGAAASVLPLGSHYGVEVKTKVKAPRFKTATGECVTSERKLKITGRG